MWKDKYKTGVEIIDSQHKDLFQKNDELLCAIEQQSGPDVYKEIVTFLKEYVIFHFQCEEDYQRSIGYGGYDAHKQTHEKFTRLVYDYGQRLDANNYPIEIVKELAGTLTAWLIYHVVYADLNMVQGKNDAADTAGMSNIQILTSSMEETFQALTGLPASSIRKQDAIAESDLDGIQINIDLTGDVNGTVTYVYTEDAAKSLFECMTMQQPQCIDEMVCSALSEITNITTGKAAVMLTGSGVNCDIRPPRILSGQNHSSSEGVILDTGNGKIKISALLDQY